MSEPKEYKNRKRGRITTIFDLHDGGGCPHIYEDTYIKFKAAALSMDPSDWGIVRTIMQGQDVSIGEDQKAELIEWARDAGVDINRETHQKIVRDWATSNFDPQYQPTYMLDIGGRPWDPKKYEAMKEKLLTRDQTDPLVPFLNAASSYKSLDNKTTISLNQKGIDGLTFDVAKAAAKSILSSQQGMS